MLCGLPGAGKSSIEKHNPYEESVLTPCTSENRGLWEEVFNSVVLINNISDADLRDTFKCFSPQQMFEFTNGWSASKKPNTFKLESMADNFDHIEVIMEIKIMTKSAPGKFKKLLAKNLWSTSMVNGELNMDILKGIVIGYAHGDAQQTGC